MAIVHVAFKSSSQAPPAAAHAHYISREGEYQRRGGVELVESGNMPEFAQADPHRFWMAADTHERANGRTYTEVQIALPRELNKGEREELARQAYPSRSRQRLRSDGKRRPVAGAARIAYRVPK